MPKPKVSKAIREATKALAEIMREQLTLIANDLTKQVMSKAKNKTPAQRYKAISGIKPRGVSNYKSLLKTALSIMALDSLEAARKEIPKAKKVKLSENLNSIKLAEFDRLPLKIQNKITMQTNLLVGKQVGDIQKVIEFAYQTAEDETDSLEQIRADINDSAIGWIDGTALESGAALNAGTIINSARNAFFFDEEVLQEIEAFEFVNGDPVTDICTDLAGTVFAKDDPAADRYFPPLHWNAILSGIPVATVGGPVAIEKIEVGMQVQTHTGAFKPVTEIMSKFEDKEYFEILLENGRRICITGEHPVLVQHMSWVRVDELAFSDEIICLEHIGKKGIGGARIVSIKRMRVPHDRTLHNIAVQDDESYIAGGIVVHNCKSYILPILTGNLGNKEIEKLKPSKKSLEEEVQFSENFDGICRHRAIDIPAMKDEHGENDSV